MQIRSGDWIVFAVNRKTRSYSLVTRKPTSSARMIQTLDSLIYREMVVAVEPTREAAKANVDEFNNEGAMK